MLLFYGRPDCGLPLWEGRLHGFDWVLRVALGWVFYGYGTALLGCTGQVALDGFLLQKLGATRDSLR